MRRWLTVAALSLGLAMPVGTAHAAPGPTPPSPPSQSGCPVPPTSQALASFGDDGWYYLVTNGSFADGLTSWRTTGGATAAPDSAPQDVMRAGGGSLSLPYGATATSDSFCTDSTHDRARFFYRGTGRPGSALRIRVTSTSNVLYSSSYTTTYVLDGGSTQWQLSPTMVVPDWTDETGKQQTTVAFEAVGGSFQVDDVVVDPWRYNTQ
ncbi:hypothetical protein [Arsenicicoccus dermatophilus]|uniref:hypothetical protein n=1 Tax=Arsenicicoccus dermatophilus TaxID=1076331 RepID=UPI003916FB1D